MKKRNLLGMTALLMTALVLVGGLAGCSNTMNDLTNSEDKTVPENLAKVVIPLPGITNARAVSLADAKAYTNYFEAAFKNKATGAVLSANASIAQEKIETTIPPGTYDILLFAGDKPQYPLLLASAYTENVGILLEETNTINLTLATFDFDIVAPSKVIIGENFTAGLIINTKNPFIVPEGGWLSYNGGEGIVMDGNIVKKEGTTYTYSTSLTAPSATGSGSIAVYGYIGVPSSTPWVCATTDHPQLGQNYRKTIAFVEGAELNINIAWPE